jgi:hypothetical protein
VQTIKIGDIVKDYQDEYGVVCKIEQHPLIQTNELVFVYYVVLFKNDESINVYFYQEQLNKVE